MATTPRGIVTPDSGDGYSLTVDLAAMADTIDDALDAVDVSADVTTTQGDITDLETAMDLRAYQEYRPANAAALAALTGMRADDIAVQLDTRARYTYSGTAWVRDPGVIVSGTFTAAATVTSEGWSGFQKYEIEFDIPTASTANELTLQLRAAGATLAANYDTEIAQASAGTASAAEAYGQPTVTMGPGARTDKHVTIRLSNLNAADRTFGESLYGGKNSGANAAIVNRVFWHTAATACDGVILTASTGTITGTYVVRGIY